MAVCIKCGSESKSCLCNACLLTTDIETLCDEIMDYRPGTGGNELWDNIGTGFNNPYHFKNIGFAVAEYLPSPRKEYRKLLSLAECSCSIPKNSRKWLYEVYALCKDAEGLSEMEQNRIRGLVMDALYKDYDFAGADELASKILASEDLPKQVYITIADFYIKTRRYEEADEILSDAMKSFPDDSYIAVNVKSLLEENERRRKAAEAGKQEYMPNPKENKEMVRQQYVKFLASLGIEAEVSLAGKKEGTKKEPVAIPKDQYPEPVETREADFNSFVAFDLETTGKKPQFDSIIEFGAIKVVDGEIVDSREFTFQEFVKPYKQKISDEIQQLTGITPDDVKDARKMWEVTPDFMEFVGDNILVGFNCVAFDSKFLARAGRYSHIVIKNKYFDVMRYAGQFKKQLGLTGTKCSLEELSEKLNIKNPNAHRALADAITTARIYLKLKDMDKESREASIDDLLSGVDTW